MTRRIRIVTWNIHKGVRGMGKGRRLEIHAMKEALHSLDADVIALQEVRGHNHKEAAHFVAWPELSQADFLAGSTYEAAYISNAKTKHGEHGNALLSRFPITKKAHQDMSDHRLEQRGLLHVQIKIPTSNTTLHFIVVHLGLIAASRKRQMNQLSNYIERIIPKNEGLVVLGDFNAPISPVCWAQDALNLGAKDVTLSALKQFKNSFKTHATFPARLPVVQLDHIFVRHAKLHSLEVPRRSSPYSQNQHWAKMSDHLPLIAEIEIDLVR